MPPRVTATVRYIRPTVGLTGMSGIHGIILITHTRGITRGTAPGIILGMDRHGAGVGIHVGIRIITTTIITLGIPDPVGPQSCLTAAQAAGTPQAVATETITVPPAAEMADPRQRDPAVMEAVVAHRQVCQAHHPIPDGIRAVLTAGGLTQDPMRRQ